MFCVKLIEGPRPHLLISFSRMSYHIGAGIDVLRDRGRKFALAFDRCPELRPFLFHTCLECRNERKLCREEILLGNTVLFIENRKCSKLDLISNLLIIVRKTSDKNVKGLAADCGAERLLRLLRAKMRKKVVYTENGMNQLI